MSKSVSAYKASVSIRCVHCAGKGWIHGHFAIEGRDEPQAINRARDITEGLGNMVDEHGDPLLEEVPTPEASIITYQNEDYWIFWETPRPLYPSELKPQLTLEKVKDKGDVYK